MHDSYDGLLRCQKLQYSKYGDFTRYLSREDFVIPFQTRVQVIDGLFSCKYVFCIGVLHAIIRRDF